MNKNTSTILIIIAVVIVLAIIGIAIVKPRYDKLQFNPYDLQLDSLGEIAETDYCDCSVVKLVLPLNEAKALAVDAEERIYVSGDNKVLVLSTRGRKITEFPTPATATAMVVNEKQQLVAAFETHIALYSTSGELISQWPDFNKKTYITSMAANKEKLYIADADDAMVYEYRMDGAYVQSIGNKTDKDDITAFILPSYFFEVAVAPDQTIWVTNNGKHKVVNFYSDGRLRSFWGETSAAVHGFSGCCNPSHLAIMEDGSFITAEKGLVRVKKYNSAGIFECAIAGPEHFQSGALGLDIAITADEQILVLEPGAKTLHIFTLQ